MKNLIITISLVLLMTYLSSYSLKINKDLRVMKELKFMAEEGAGTAALFVDEEAYGEGEVSFQKEVADKKTKDIIEKNMSKEYKGEYKTTISYKEGENPMVEVEIMCNKLKGKAIYELVERK